MNTNDIRREQRFGNFIKALKIGRCSQIYPIKFLIEDDNKFDEIVNDLIKQGLIQSFEFTHELAWNVIKDYSFYQGNPKIRGSRDAVREGFAMGLIAQGEVWMEMIKSKNET